MSHDLVPGPPAKRGDRAEERRRNGQEENKVQDKTHSHTQKKDKQRRVAGPPESVEVVELDSLHEVKRVLELFFRLSRESHYYIPRDGGVGGNLRTENNNIRYVDTFLP